MSVENSITVGKDIAAKVADRLEKGEELVYRHRDYCGMGLRFVENVFVYGEAQDGYILAPVEISTWSKPPESWEYRTFAGREDFIRWLAVQTDESLSGIDVPKKGTANNQRLTIKRLADFAAGEPVPFRQ